MTHPIYNQPWLDEFDIIRSFHDSEVTGAIHQLLHQTPFIEHFQILFGDYLQKLNSSISVADFVGRLQEADTVKKLQAIEKQFLDKVMAPTLAKVQIEGLSDGSLENGRLLISNHRDIVLDPMLINWALLNNRSNAAHCAIGDNLLVAESGKLIAQLNKCFAVLRSVKSPKALVRAMQTQSAYIRHLRFDLGENIWIAQKEGRSKDNSDKTNPALIKMLVLSKPKEVSLAQYLKDIRLTPVSLSYEWDPCDIQKAEELLSSEQGTYIKQGAADLKAVQDGLIGDKGRIRLFFDTEFADRIPEEANHHEVASMIDQSIRCNYQLFPVNFAAKALKENRPVADFVNEEATESELADAFHELKKRLDRHPKAVADKVVASYAAPALACGD